MGGGGGGVTKILIVVHGCVGSTRKKHDERMTYEVCFFAVCASSPAPPGEAVYVCLLPSTHYHNSTIKARGVGCCG